MKQIIKKIWAWLCSHQDAAHLIGGFGFGFVFDDPWAGVIAGITSEVKDVQWRGKPTFKDFLLTSIGGLIGSTLRYFLKS